ncbi:PREDICTED: uncharacterized protein LOC107072756 [Polistes dominula]|uniref:Uncharacterized protein LOC107072756 n=1 Tax=Polistes dominula TaxID=743375 RepID=A0ABM1J7I4_POLDO|nr:PREDICTED: uncharacterized protein LOC107072756 [Polistes dominula]
MKSLLTSYLSIMLIHISLIEFVMSIPILLFLPTFNTTIHIGNVYFEKEPGTITLPSIENTHFERGTPPSMWKFGYMNAPVPYHPYNNDLEDGSRNKGEGVFGSGFGGATDSQAIINAKPIDCDVGEKRDGNGVCRSVIS